LRKRRFPARNRIIAGLALATVVVEARDRSGALITADFALELGRDVFAVPGEITSGLSAGTNDLLRHGAAPLTSVRDVLDALCMEMEPSGAVLSVSDAAAAVLAMLGNGAAGADELTRASGLSTAEVAAALVELELAGLTAQADGVYRSFSQGRSRGARTPV
jgi:DNA processing protein